MIDEVLQACKYLTYYAREIYKMSLYDSSYVFLIDAFSSEIQKVLIEMSLKKIPLDNQIECLETFGNLEPTVDENHLDRVRYNSARRIKISLCLFYMDQNEETLVAPLIQGLIEDLILALWHTMGEMGP